MHKANDNNESSKNKGSARRNSPKLAKNARHDGAALPLTLIGPIHRTQGIEASAVGITPSEQRLLRLFAAVPEHQRQSFFSLMDTICLSCNWQVDAGAALQVTSSDSSNVIDAASRFGAPMRIDTIPLFGSRKLTLASDERAWIFSSNTTPAEACSERESMFINAALRAAKGA